jgi:hypothetical protein
MFWGGGITTCLPDDPRRPRLRDEPTAVGSKYAAHHVSHRMALPEQRGASKPTYPLFDVLGIEESSHDCVLCTVQIPSLLATYMCS